MTLLADRCYPHLGNARCLPDSLTGGSWFGTFGKLIHTSLAELSAVISLDCARIKPVSWSVRRATKQSHSQVGTRSVETASNPRAKQPW